MLLWAERSLDGRSMMVENAIRVLPPVAVAPLLKQHAGHARQGQGAWRLSGSPWTLGQAWAS